MYNILKMRINTGGTPLAEIQDRVKRLYANGDLTTAQMEELLELSQLKANPEAERPELPEILRSLVERVEALEKKIKESVNADRLTVIIAKAPCALLKGQKFTQVCVVSEGKCRHCNMCMKIGCPAISKVNGEIKINASMCNGCGLCQSYCKFGAIERVER